jgi:hypothetical protein
MRALKQRKPPNNTTSRSAISDGPESSFGEHPESVNRVSVQDATPYLVANPAVFPQAYRSRDRSPKVIGFTRMIFQSTFCFTPPSERASPGCRLACTLRTWLRPRTYVLLFANFLSRLASRVAAAMLRLHDSSFSQEACQVPPSF